MQFVVELQNAEIMMRCAAAKSFNGLSGQLLKQDWQKVHIVYGGESRPQEACRMGKWRAMKSPKLAIIQVQTPWDYPFKHQSGSGLLPREQRTGVSKHCRIASGVVRYRVGKMLMD